MRTIGSDNPAEWQGILERCDFYDVYHLAEYHSLLTETDAGVACKLFVYEEGDALAAIPLVLRSLAGIEGVEELASYFDATSVYGYPGPVTNECGMNKAFFQRFGKALLEELSNRNVICAFSRLHPISNNGTALTIGEVIALGQTVSIDLSQTNEDQLKGYRKGHRHDIRKTCGEKVSVVHDTDWRYFEDFLALYWNTMRRVRAESRYWFDRTYFERLREKLHDRLHLFVALRYGKPISAALFTQVNGMTQYHLSGSSSEELDFAASKCVIDEARKWAKLNGATHLHLGGGLNSDEDSLFKYKAGFSANRHRFSVWQLVVDADVYDRAVEQRRVWLKRQGANEYSQSTFPKYRTIIRL